MLPVNQHLQKMQAKTTIMRGEPLRFLHEMEAKIHGLFEHVKQRQDSFISKYGHVTEHDITIFSCLIRALVHIRKFVQYPEQDVTAFAEFSTLPEYLHDVRSSANTMHMFLQSNLELLSQDETILGVYMYDIVQRVEEEVLYRQQYASHVYEKVKKLLAICIN